MRTTRAGRLTAVLGALVLGATTMAAGPPAEAAAPYRAPVAQPLPDPGVVHTGSQWVVLSTGSWSGLHIGVASAPAGPYTVTTSKLLTRRAKWMSTTDRSVWAPSIVEATPGHFAVYYAGVVKGTAGRRCIGSASGTSATGPFVPDDRPVACWAGSGTRPHDAVTSEGAGFGLIDATPAQLGGSLVLTYKTQYKASGSRIWHTTTRLVALDPAHPGRTVANPVHRGGGSVKISDSKSTYIEENPVLVAHEKGYTLFTSYGWFGTCVYSTRYRQNTDLWRHWLAKPHHALTFAKKPRTCGTGNAQVTAGPTPGSWRIFFNGHLDHTAKPTDQHHPRGPQGLYVARLTWTHGKPVVSSFAR